MTNNMLKGKWVHLNYGVHKVAVHFSRFLHIESVYVDDHLMSEKQNFFQNHSIHIIHIDDKQHLIDITFGLSMQTRSVVSLKKGGRVLLSEKTPIFRNKKQWRWYIAFVVSFPFIGFAVGYLLSKLLIGTA